jgi:tetratricopeptide (TPR) repeat protein
MKLTSNIFLKKTTFTILGIILSIAFLEIFVRIFFYQNITPSLLSPAFGIPFAMRPNFKSEALNAVETKYTIQTNVNRLRRKSPVEYKKPPNTFRILCIGDSITFGLSISNNETYSNYLEEILNKNLEGTQFEVLNAGVTGWEPIDYFLYLKNEGVKYSPDLVIIGLEASDIVNLKSSFFNFEKLEVKKSPETVNILLTNPDIKPYFEHTMGTIREGIVNLPLFLQLSEVSQFLNLVRKNLSIDFSQTKKTTDPLDNLIVNESISSKDIVNWHITNNSKDLKFTQSSLFDLQKILFAIIQNKTENLAKEKNFKLAWVKMPYAPEVFGTIEPKDDANKTPAPSSKFINLLKEFKAFSGKTRIPLYFPNDIHFTPSGNRLFAYLLLNSLIETKKIKKNPIDINSPSIIQEIQKVNGEIGTKIKQLPVWNLILAKKYKSLHQLNLAEKTLQLYLEQEPNSGEGLFQMGIIYHDLEQWDQALKYLSRAFKSNKFWKAEILNLLAKTYYKKGDFSNARNYWLMAINENPKDQKIFRNLGSLFFDNGHYKEAIEVYKASLRINPNSYEIYLFSGLAFLKLQKNDKAIEMFQNVLRLRPNNLLAQGVLKQLSPTK